MTEARRAALLYNPVSGDGRAAALTSLAAERLQAQGFEIRRLETRRAGHGVELVRDCAKDIDLLVVAGGDGTCREACVGLGGEGARVEIVLLPCGNANVVARELGLPLDPHPALDALERGQPRAVDVGDLDGDLFLAMVGTGWDARTVDHLARLRATRFGRAWYALWADSLWLFAGLRALFVRPRIRTRILVDGHPLPGTYPAAVVANFSCYGKGWAAVPQADATSGKLHYQARKRAGPLWVAWQLLAAFRKRQLPAFVSDYGEGSCIELRADRPFPVQVDGDAHEPRDAIRVQVRPAAARFRVF